MKPAAILLASSLLLLTFCSPETNPDPAAAGSAALAPKIDSLLLRAEEQLDGLTAVSYQVLYSFTSVNADAPTHNVFNVTFAPDKEDTFGGKIFASNAAKYHVLYNGTQILEGYPGKGEIKRIDTSRSLQTWLGQRFVKNARIGFHHGARIVEKLRSSPNIKSLALRDSTWEDEAATKLIVNLGAKEPVTSGLLEILFRDADAMPVSVTETLTLNLEGEQREQFQRTEYINIDTNPNPTEGQFDARALPGIIVITE